MAGTRHEWWENLAALSPVIAGLPKPSDEQYWDHASKEALNAAAFNLSGCREHNTAIARWADEMLRQGVPLAQIEKMLIDLTSRNTRGTFSELSAYGLLLDASVPFRIQVPMPGTAILNPNGSDLDGELNIGNPIYFDVKAFGLAENLADELRGRLSSAFPSDFVAIGGSIDGGVAELSHLLGKDFKPLVAELAKVRKATRGMLDIRLEPQRQVQSVINTADPYALAESNASYAFKYAKQFVRREPFILIFVIHPWLGGFRLFTDFSQDGRTFMRSFARRTFMQFRSDRSKVLGVTRGTASKLLSGIMFVDAWQKARSKPPLNALYLNPHARHPVSRLSRDHLLMSIPDMSIEDFEHDVY
jgi:hypothetical protein